MLEKLQNASCPLSHLDDSASGSHALCPDRALCPARRRVLFGDNLNASTQMMSSSMRAKAGECST